MTRGLVLVVWLCAMAAPLPAAQPELGPEASLIQARERFDAGEYETALALLDDSISRIGTPAEGTRAALLLALQLRARVQFTLGNEPAAQADFSRLLALDPAHSLPVEVSPRIAALFAKVRANSIGTLTLLLDPIDAAVQIDGQPAAINTPITLPVGEHTVRATRPGHNPYSATVLVTGGSDERVAVTLPRVSAVLSIITSPPGVEVLVDGNVRALTEAGPLPSEYADLPGRLALSPSQIARPLVIPDLKPGTYTIQFRRACFQSETRSVTIEQPRDYSLAPMVLKPAVATLSVEVPDTGAIVYVDNQPRGSPPIRIRDLCEGEHTVDVRSSHGRFVESVTATPGGSVALKAVLKPAFAVLPVAGLPEGYRGHDPRLDVLRALRSAEQLTFLIPADSALKPLMDADRLRDDALSFDLARRPLGSAALMTPAARRDIVRRLSEALDVQGLVSVTAMPGETVGRHFVLGLLARGGSEPDLFAMEPGQSASVAAVLERLDLAPAVSMPVLGMVGVDLTGVSGVVVARVEDGGAAQAAGLTAGDRITQLLAEPVASEAALLRILNERRGAESLPAVVVGKDGVSRQVALRPALVPRLVSVLDRTLPFNALAAHWRHQASQPSGSEIPLVRLNLSIAALRIGDFEAARDDLVNGEIRAAGVWDGTVQYLLGLAYKGLGDFPKAREAWTRAAADPKALLSEVGGRVADLAREQLQALGPTP